MEKEMVILMATAVPTEKLIADMQDALKEWQIYKDDHHEQKLVFFMQLIIMSFITKGDMKKAMKVMKDMHTLDSVSNHIIGNDN